MRISEIFYSLQGEGIYAGAPTVFVRFQGCNLVSNCTYCDTTYAQSTQGGREMSILDVLSAVRRCSPRGVPWVCITGGEPLRQLDSLEELVKELKWMEYKITIETNGSLPAPRWYHLVDSWNADIKCPSSGVSGVSREDWFDMRECDQIKFVVGTREDLDFAKRVIRRHLKDKPVILVSPVAPKDGGWSKEWLWDTAEFCKEEGVRLSLQIHKIVWGDVRGV